MDSTVNLNLLEYSWTAEVELKNGQILTIWYTAWHSSKHIIKNILSISTDLPRYKIKRGFCDNINCLCCKK